MTIPTTYLSVHDITGLQVLRDTALGNPLVLVFDSPHGAMRITLFLHPLLTPDRVEALAEAMRGVLTTGEPIVVPVPPDEAAAYKAHDDYWARLKIDLDRHPIESTDPEAAHKIVAARYLTGGGK